MRVSSDERWLLRDGCRPKLLRRLLPQAGGRPNRARLQLKGYLFAQPRRELPSARQPTLITLCLAAPTFRGGKLGGEPFAQLSLHLPPRCIREQHELHAFSQGTLPVVRIGRGSQGLLELAEADAALAVCAQVGEERLDHVRLGEDVGVSESLLQLGEGDHTIRVLVERVEAVSKLPHRHLAQLVFVLRDRPPVREEPLAHVVRLVERSRVDLHRVHRG
eukprot:CAMPEP_0113236732 /NCGR_PEP_ID=MMETSP0008_2-20120614/4252_1 /TAXON_ID=97485 /ORGANISM="Prymnesium parvum" /LENGTH=218 /DNA_ID=CAMNT_0000083757 /DNA_START=424 /DNA_END=1080 /DNA_ORIENTATION=- /assembly_acc=CAM_ASM_000153